MWRVNIEGIEQSFSDPELRHKLRSGAFSGLEPARREGEPSSRPLHTFRVFSEEVPHAGSAMQAARDRVASALFWHGSAYCVCFAALLYSRPSWWFWPAGLWGLAVFVHGSRAVPVLLRTRDAAHAQESGATDASSGLEAIRAGLDGLGGDTGAVMAAARRVAACRESLQALIDRSGEDRDPVVRRAERALERLEARERGLIHELTSVRLVSSQAHGEEAPSPEFVRNALEDVVRKLDATCVLDESLQEALAAHSLEISQTSGNTTGPPEGS